MRPGMLLPQLALCLFPAFSLSCTSDRGAAAPGAGPPELEARPEGAGEGGRAQEAASPWFSIPDRIAAFEKRSRAVKVENDLRAIVLRAEIAHAIRGAFPASLEELKSLRDPDTGEVLDLGMEIPLDPWGREYRYTLQRGRPVASTLGKDGAEGGEGEDRDCFSSEVEDEEVEGEEEG